jgi:hypothetical protein
VGSVHIAQIAQLPFESAYSVRKIEIRTTRDSCAIIDRGPLTLAMLHAKLNEK